MSLSVKLCKMHTVLRPYQANDKQQVIKLFLLNTPGYFDPKEEEDLLVFLDEYPEEYYVIVKDDGHIIASGGNIIKGDTGWLSWYIVHPDAQGEGLGTVLVKYNIRKLKENTQLSAIKVRTSQLVYKFYEKAGFKVFFTQKDYWGKGLDLYEMELH